MSHFLQNTWIFYEHKTLKDASAADWSNSCVRISECSTVEEFWSIFSYLPLLSQILYNGVKFQSSIDGFSIFKKGIKPSWEDPVNLSGCELRFPRGISNLDLLDKYWENICLGLIGQIMDVDDNDICGCRITDKSKLGKKTLYNVQLWLSTTDAEKIQNIKTAFIKILIDKMNIKIPDLTVILHNDK